MWCLQTLSDDIFAPQTTLIVKLHKNSLYYGCYNHSNTARAALACYHDAQARDPGARLQVQAVHPGLEGPVAVAALPQRRLRFLVGSHRTASGRHA